MTTKSWSSGELESRIFEACLGAFDVHAIYLGDRLGFYRAMAGRDVTSGSELAELTHTNERLAREWLEQQAVSGLLEVVRPSDDPLLRGFRLPAGYAEVLTDRESLNYLAPAAVQVAAAGLALPKVLAAFRTGNGVPWADYGNDMREAQGEMNRPLFLQVLGKEWLPAIPDLHARLSGKGARVADVGCGFGWSTIGMALAYPEMTVDGFDLDVPSVETARTNASEYGVADRVTFHAIDPGEAHLAGAYDLAIALECIHDLPDPVGVLASMARMTGDHGTVLVVDERTADEFTAPGDDMERFFYGFSVTTCLPDGMSHQPSAGTGTVMRAEQLRGYAQEAGFADLEVLPIDHGQFRIYRLSS